MSNAPSIDGFDAAEQLRRAQALRSQGHLDAAISLYRTALEFQPGLAEAHNGMGIALVRKGHFDEAIKAFKAAVAASPFYPEALNNLGNALDARGLPEEAVSAFRSAIKLNRTYAKAYTGLGEALRHAGHASEAEDAMRSALMMWPNSAEVHYGLGAALRGQNRLAEAADEFRAAIGLKPNYPEAHNDLGEALHTMVRGAEAEQAYRAAIAYRPDYAEALSNYGSLLSELGRFEESADMLEQSIAFFPELAEAHSNLANTLLMLGRPRDAERASRAALGLRPGLPEAHSTLGVALLALGAYEEGWREYAWRWKVANGFLRPRAFTQPYWTGEPLNGRTILLFGEQGLGDILQFARYAREAAAAGGRVILEVYRPLRRLLATVPGVSEVVVGGEATPHFDLQISMMNMPQVVGTTLDTIPGQVPYLSADPGEATAWAQRLATHPGPKVGLVWAGDPRPTDYRSNTIDSRRSMALARLTPVLEVPGITFVNLQKGAAAEQLKELPEAARPIDHMDEMKDFADTAALVANLDLVITVDTSVAHLVGAMGKPVWILSRYDACWRWMRDRDDTPWYPTARLFRQAEPGAWDPVIAHVADALGKHFPRP